MEIQFRKPSFRYAPGQWIFINVPAVSKWQWHPFTITSCPTDPSISIHIRQVGDFTKRLGQVLGTQAVPAGVENALANGRNMPVLRVDGPFGAPAEDVLDNEIAVLVGAGIGVTPWASVLKHILSEFKTAHPPQRLRRVEFIWYFPFPKALLMAGSFRISIHLNGSKRSSLISNKRSSVHLTMKRMVLRTVHHNSFEYITISPQS